MQHIPVHEIRYNYFKEFFRVLRPDGLISFQMGFGPGHRNTASYYENNYNALYTNSGHDVRVDNPDQLVGDLTKIGFVNIQTFIRNRWDDSHDQWIYVKARKPKE